MICQNIQLLDDHFTNQGLHYRNNIMGGTLGSGAWRGDMSKIWNTSLAVPGALAHRLQRRTACNAEPPASGPQNGQP